MKLYRSRDLSKKGYATVWYDYYTPVTDGKYYVGMVWRDRDTRKWHAYCCDDRAGSNRYGQVAANLPTLKSAEDALKKHLEKS